MRCAVLLWFLAPVLCAAQALQPPAFSVPTLQGVVNFRDAGGEKTEDGHVVRSGVIFRSAELSHLTETDLAAIAPLHIRYIFDLRTEAERTSNPTHWLQAPPETLWIPVGFASGQPADTSMKRLFANGTDPVHTSDAMRALTVQIAIDGAQDIGKVLHDLTTGDEPALVHCTAGKDRTGIVIAVLLRILGVPEEAVYADYLRSNDAVPEQLARMKAASTNASAPSPLAKLPPESIKVLMGVDRSYLEAAFAAMQQKYGSFDGYVSRGLLLSQADLEALRAGLLIPAS